MSALDAFLRSPDATHAESGTVGKAVVLSAFTNDLGQACRVIEQRVFIAGQRVHATGTVCRQPDGRWLLWR
jgi:surface antigen